MIKTFIFFDLETTGLIGIIMPKITELSLIAVSKNAISKTKDNLPRVLHKLVMPIHPNLNISLQINKITGLSDTNLQGVSYFNDETYNVIMNFINLQPQPVCFVAYNGNKFDYPIFLSELKNINKSFSEDILSIDMLDLIKDYFSPNNLNRERFLQNTASVSNTEGDSSLLNDGCDEILCEAMDSIMSSITDNHNKIKQENEESKSFSNSGINTPTTSYCKKMQEINEKTPENQIIKLQDADKNLHNKKRYTARRKLDFTHDKPNNYKLSTVFEYMCRTCAENTHTAEGDCICMIRCAIKIGEYFVEWAENRKTPFIKYERH